MAVAHAVNSSDPFLLAWRKDVPNPIDFGAGCVDLAAFGLDH